MISFSEWVSRQRSVIDGRLWLRLSMCTAQLDHLIRKEAYDSAMQVLSEAYDLVSRPELRGWRALLHLVEGGLQLNATGDLNHVLDLAVKAVTAAQDLKGDDHDALRIGARLLLLRSWMKRDEVGYAEDALAAGEEVLARGDLGHWKFWYQASNAWALWAMGRDSEAQALLVEMLASFPSNVRHADGVEARAYIAYRMRQTLEASDLYKQAAVLFYEAGLLHAATRSSINHAICLHDSGAYDEARQALTEIKPRLSHVINPHYTGLLHCFLGRAALAVGACTDAVEALEQALTLYDGRGWLRDETAIALDLLEARQAVGDDRDWDELIAHARGLLSNMRSTDLQVRLEKLIAH